MNEKIIIGISLVLCSNIVAAVSQLLLKKAAGKTYSVWWRSYINPYVITAYAMLFATTILGVFALRYIPLTLSAAFAASGQIFVPVLSFLVLHEKISKKKCLGMLLIVVGIVVFSL